MTVPDPLSTDATVGAFREAWREFHDRERVPVQRLVNDYNNREQLPTLQVINLEHDWYRCQYCDEPFDPIPHRWLCPYCKGKNTCCE
jgi:hypothetical protein